jgi:PadR family transcriptional regulator PadR
MKSIKNFNPEALINSEKYRQYIENFESEVLRGISKLIILYAVKQEGEKGIYGYKLAQDLKNEMMNELIIKEGTLYPILRRLKEEGLLRINKKEYNGRLRNYYIITQNGINIYNHLIGFLTHLIALLSKIVNIKIDLDNEHYLICPNCLNRINIEKADQENCIVCGLILDQFRK